MFSTYRWDLEKQWECGVVARERLSELRVTMEWLLAKPRSISNLPAFLDLNGNNFFFQNIKLMITLDFSRLDSVRETFVIRSTVLQKYRVLNRVHWKKIFRKTYFIAFINISTKSGIVSFITIDAFALKTSRRIETARIWRAHRLTFYTLVDVYARAIF